MKFLARLRCWFRGYHVGGSVVYYSSGGTAASPTQTLSGDPLGVNFGIGYSAASSTYLTGAGAGFIMEAAENYDATHGGANLQLLTTPLGTVLQGVVAVLWASGGFTVVAAGGSDPGAGAILAGTHLLAGISITPSISSCGTSPSVAGGDNFGKITAGGGALTSCVINFGKTWGAAPSCTVSSTTALASLTVTASTTQLTVGGTSLTGGVITYTCGSTASLEPGNDNFADVTFEKTG